MILIESAFSGTETAKVLKGSSSLRYQRTHSDSAQYLELKLYKVNKFDYDSHLCKEGQMIIMSIWVCDVHDVKTQISACNCKLHFNKPLNNLFS